MDYIENEVNEVEDFKYKWYERIFVNNRRKEDEWQLACLNVDLAVKKSELSDAKANLDLYKSSRSCYFSNIETLTRELSKIHQEIGSIALKYYGRG